jgi:hypothetical protein
MTLVVPLTALGTWPIAGDCPPETIPGFVKYQTKTRLTTTVTVDPTLPDGADVLPAPPRSSRRLKWGTAYRISLTTSP